MALFLMTLGALLPVTVALAARRPERSAVAVRSRR